MPVTLLSFGCTSNNHSRHASPHVRDARAVMHVGIANEEETAPADPWTV